MANSGTKTSNGSVGVPREAAEALLRAIAKPAAGPAPDPGVSTAFSLGWHLGELRAALEPQCFAAPDLGSPLDDYLAGSGASDRRHLAVRQADEALGRLTQRLGEDALPSSASPADPRRRYEQTLTDLWAADPQLGKALGLGRLTYALTRLERSEDALAGESAAAETDASLVETRPLPAGETSVDAALRRYAPQLERALSDLASLLPENAAHSVLNSLRLWWQEKELRQTATEGALESVSLDAEFRAQGDRWRGVLSGEVAARDLVRFRDYLGSIEGLSAQFWEVAKEGALKSWPLALGALALLIIGIVMLFFAPTEVPGAGVLLAAFGLSWKGIGGFIGKPIAKGEQDLWDAQMDWTIAYRITTLPPQARDGIERTLGTLSRGERRRWAHLDDLLRFQERPPAAAHANAPRGLLAAIGAKERA